MPALKWNLCTSFAGIGAVIAYPILFAFFGFHWQLVPTAAAGLVAAYLVSTVLGALALRFQLGRYPIAGIILSVGSAWCTLLAGALAISVMTFSVAIIGGLSQAPSGQTALNVLAEIAPGYAHDLIRTPLTAGVLFGLLPATVLGVIYGVLLRSHFDHALAKAPSSSKWVLRATAATLLLPVLLITALIAVPDGVRQFSAHYANVPIGIRSCSESAEDGGVMASCRGSPCEQGECDWEVEQDAFELRVRPPAGSDWRWAGGGIGTGRRPDLVIHNIYWVKYEPDGQLLESSPRRYASYKLLFDGDFINIGAQQFRFEPGIQLEIQFLADWSVASSLRISPD